MKDLRDRVALVTGGSRGIGAAVAIALAGAGADVAVNYRERADAANAVCSEITGIGRKAIALQADVSVAADVQRMVAEVEKQIGGIDILVNNAAITHPHKLEEITETEWDEVLTVNLKSVFLVTQAVIGGMRRRKWGRIINLSSVAAQTGGAVGADYAAALCQKPSRATGIAVSREWATLDLARSSLHDHDIADPTSRSSCEDAENWYGDQSEACDLGIVGAVLNTVERVRLLVVGLRCRPRLAPLFPFCKKPARPISTPEFAALRRNLDDLRHQLTELEALFSPNPESPGTKS